MSTSAEKLVKQTIKLLSKTQDLDYDELKNDAKKLIKAARNYDDTLLGMMEEIMDLGNVGSREELDDYNIEVLKIYCRIKDIDPSGSERTIRSKVWEAIESEYDVESSDEEEDESEPEEDSELESEPEPEPAPEPEKRVKPKKPKSESQVVVIG